MERNIKILQEPGLVQKRKLQRNGDETNRAFPFEGVLLAIGDAQLGRVISATDRFSAPGEMNGLFNRSSQIDTDHGGNLFGKDRVVRSRVKNIVKDPGSAKSGDTDCGDSAIPH